MDGASGAVLWERQLGPCRLLGDAHRDASAGQAQIITPSVPWVIAYAARDGTELWRVEGAQRRSHAVAHICRGLVLATSPHEKLWLFGPTAHGDVTKTHVAWAAEDNIPDITSPVSNGELSSLLTTPGMLTCYDVKDGKNSGNKISRWSPRLPDVSWATGCTHNRKQRCRRRARRATELRELAPQ